VAVLDLQGKGRCALRELRLIDEEIRLLTHMERMRGQSQQDGNSEVTLEHETASAGSGLGVTYVSSVEGQLLLREETVSAVFKPRMQGPTMSLEEFADIELADALERQAREKNQERSDDGTLRWKHLVEQGLEDDADLADRATVNDREWDAWREANPRGSGNKLGKRF
jgi:immunoglobulin-binding protein 1